MKKYTYYSILNMHIFFTPIDLPNLLTLSIKTDNIKLILGNQPYLYKENMSREELKHIWMPAEFCPKDNKIPSLGSVLKGMQDFNDSTKKIATEHGITFVDLNNALPKKTEYFVDDVHYTKKGSQKIAETLYQVIIKHNLIP